MKKVLHKSHDPLSTSGHCARCKRTFQYLPFHYETERSQTLGVTLRYCPLCKNGPLPGTKFPIIHGDFFSLPTLPQPPYKDRVLYCSICGKEIPRPTNGGVRSCKSTGGLAFCCEICKGKPFTPKDSHL